MARCQKCGKGRSVGRKSRHRRGVASKKFANKATKKSRLFRPNLQKISFMAGGLALTMVLCTRCIKKMKQVEKNKKVKTKSEKPQRKAKRLSRSGGSDNKKIKNRSQGKAKKPPVSGKKKTAAKKTTKTS